MIRNPLRAPVEALRFVIDFVQMDVEQASQAELKAAERRVRQLIELFLEDPNRLDWASQEWVKQRPVPRAELKRLHAAARTLLTGIVISGNAEVALRLNFSVVNASSLTRPLYFPVVWIGVNGSPRDRFLYRVIRLLDELGIEKLHTCPAPKCGRLFFKVTRKEFCSTRCQSRVYMRRYRQGQTR
jgi:CGNR zinc finger